MTLPMTTIYLSPSLREQIGAHLANAYPNEGGGFLLGTVDVPAAIIQIHAIQPIQNIAATVEQYHRYTMQVTDWVQAEDYAEAHGLALVGYFHSHPDHPAVPSTFDRDHALTNFVYLIVSVQQRQVADLRAWRLNTATREFDALRLEYEPAD